MLFGSTTITSTQTLSGTESQTPMNTYHWLLILGFPVDVAAAKAMPDLFSDAAPVPFVTDGVRIFPVAEAA